MRYRVMFGRWLVYCRFPMTYKRLPYYQPYKVFDQDFIVIVGPILVEKLRRYKSTVSIFRPSATMFRRTNGPWR